MYFGAIVIVICHVTGVYLIPLINGVCTDTTGCKPEWQYGQPKCDKGIQIFFFINNRQLTR